MLPELLILLGLVLVNGLFAGVELAVLTSRKARIAERAGAGDRRAVAVMALRDRPERFLATVQIGITVIGSAAAAFGGASIAGDLVTIENLVEELVGDIFGENQRSEDILCSEPDGSALVPGWVPIRKLNRALDTALPISGDSITIAGLCMSLAVAVPPVGARLTAIDGTTLEIVDASPRRVRMVRVHRRGGELAPGIPQTAGVDLA